MAAARRRRLVGARPGSLRRARRVRAARYRRAASGASAHSRDAPRASAKSERSLRYALSVALPLADADVRVGVGRDLREVRDDEDLVAPRQRPQAAPDRIGGPAADPRV